MVAAKLTYLAAIIGGHVTAKLPHILRFMTKQNSIWSKALIMPLTIWNCVLSYLCTFFHCLFCILLDVIRLIKWRLNKDLLFSLYPTRKTNTKVPVKVNKENKL